MPTSEEHLRQDVGSLIAQLLVAGAILKSENDRLKAELARYTDQQRAPVDGAPA